MRTKYIPNTNQAQYCRDCLLLADHSLQILLIVANVLIKSARTYQNMTRQKFRTPPPPQRGRSRHVTENYVHLFVSGPRDHQVLPADVPGS
jgi:hypothetical protein